MSRPIHPVFVISDGTGNTAEKSVRAAFRQFEGHPLTLRTFPMVTTEAKLGDLFQRAKAQQAMVVSTLVQPEMRTHAHQFANDLGVRHIDLIGQLLGEFEVFLHQKPVGVPGLLHRADDTYFRRVEAVEYTVKVDDGKEPRMLQQADVLLVGISRTSKTPLSTFLAHKGLKVANIPIVLDRPLPPALFTVQQDRIFALTIDAAVLRDIRLSRLKHMRVNGRSNYGDFEYILAELEYAQRLFRQNPMWPVLDVTNKALEETAAHIVAYLNDRGYSFDQGEIGQL